MERGPLGVCHGFLLFGRLVQAEKFGVQQVEGRALVGDEHRAEPAAHDGPGDGVLALPAMTAMLDAALRRASRPVPDGAFVERGSTIMPAASM